MISVNPFDSPEVKKQILGEMNVTPQEDIQDLSDFQEIIDNTPVFDSKTGKAVQTIIRDASAVVKDDHRGKSEQMNLVLSDIMTKYNQEYGLDLRIDMNSFSNTLLAVSDERSQRILELYTSKVVRSIRIQLILMMISRLSLALEHLLSVDNLLDRNNLSYTDLFLIAK